MQNPHTAQKASGALFIARGCRPDRSSAGAVSRTGGRGRERHSQLELAVKFFSSSVRLFTGKSRRRKKCKNAKLLKIENEVGSDGLKKSVSSAHVTSIVRCQRSLPM